MYQDLEITGLYRKGIVYAVRIHAQYDYRAVGHNEYGRQYEDQMVDIIRKATEQCDCLQSFFIIHSLGGGMYVY